jgi:Skp family chaperone for outer membrane proteins
MLQALLPFLTAIALSAIAAFYSVIGLAQIFPGSFWPIILMGSVLEVAKLVTVSWLYNNWAETNRLMKYYFSIAIVLLMAITSMGIFGYLSRAHIESNVVVGANTVQLRTIETQERIAREKLDYLLKRAGDPATATNRIDKEIQTTQNELNRLSKEKLPLMKEENKLTAEIGPIKYIAEIFYDKNDAGFIDKAVRLVIFTIIIVFDPLAILLLIAANQTYKRYKNQNEEEVIPIKKAKKKKKVDNTASNTLESFYVDGEMHEIIPKSKITTLDGGQFQ